MKKILGITVIVLAALIILLVLGRNLIARVAVVSVIKSITGLSVEVAGMDIGLPRTYLLVRGVKLHNSPEFTEPLMAELPELYVAYNLGAIMRNKIYLPELRLNVKELVVVRDAKGNLNLNALKSLMPAQKGGPAPEMKIDTMELTLGKVVYINYFSVGSPSVTEFKLNLHERYDNITDPNALVGLVLMKAMKLTNLGQFLDVDLGSLVKGYPAQAEALVDTAIQELGTASGGVKKTADELKKLLNFGE